MNQITNIVIQTIQEIFKRIYTSIDNNIISVLDNIAFLNSSIIKDKSIINIMGDGKKFGTIQIAYTLIFGILIYYGITNLINKISNENKLDNPAIFTMKVILNSIYIIYSFSICMTIININSLITEEILIFGKNITGENISFNHLIEKINRLVISGDEISFFSIDGVIKSFVSFAIINLIFMYGLRYIYIKILCIVSPFILLTRIFNKNSNVFSTWLKSFLGLLFLQNLIALILILIFSLNMNIANVMNKIICVSGIYALMQINELQKEIYGSSNININMNLNRFMRG